MGEDMVPQFTRSKELWIAAHHFGRVILFRRIREIDIIAQDFQDAFWRKRSANKGPKRIKPLAGFVFIVDFLPFVEKFEWRVGRSQFVLRPVADNRQCTIFQQGRYIPHIASTNLRVGIAYGGILLGRVFEFDDADRYAVYKKQNVGPTVLTALFHDKLVDATENIMVGMLEVDVLQAERIIPAITVCKIISVAIEQEGVLQGIIIVLAASVPQIGDNAVHLGSGQFFIFVLSGKKCPQVFFNKRVGIFPVNVIAERILPMRLTEKFNSRLLKLAFVESSV